MTEAAQPAQQSQEPMISVPVSLVNGVLQVLGEMPLKVGLDVFVALRNTAAQQLQEQQQK